MNFFETIVSEEDILILENILLKEKEAKNEWIHPNSCTVKGFTTNNLLKKQEYNDIFNKLLLYLPEQYQNLKYCWFHMIDYEINGKQKVHNHSETEDYSFIVYLTTCKQGGETVFYLDPTKKLSFLPVKGKMIFFPSFLDHFGDEVIDKKKIAVGALVNT